MNPPRFDYIVQYLTSRLFLTLTQALPLGAALRLGELGGRLMPRWTRKNFDTGVQNLLSAFPGMRKEEATQLILRMYEHFGRASAEMSLAPRLLTKSNWRNHVVIRNEERFHAVRDAGKGAIFVTLHMGVWEMFGILLHHLGFDTTTVYRPIKNPYIEKLILKSRRALGQSMIPRDGALPSLLRVLRHKGYIALLTDQHAKRDGVWAPFFGRPASATPAPALLALRSGAPIVTGYTRRLPGTYQFEAVVDEPIHVLPSGDRDADVYRVTLEINRRFEQYIRVAPEQWLWVHRRWHRIPAALDEKGKWVNVGSPRVAD